MCTSRAARRGRRCRAGSYCQLVKNRDFTHFPITLNLNMVPSSNVRTWATAISTNAHDGRKIVFRYAQELNPVFDPASQPVRIIMVWKYESEGGQPTAEDYQRMNLLEDTLESALNQDLATLALVSTGEGLREWTYYVRSEDEFLARLNYAFPGSPRFPIEIHTAYDPNWDVYRDFKSGVRGDAT